MKKERCAALSVFLCMLLGNQTGAQVLSQQKISQTEGGFPATLQDSDEFGTALAYLGDLDGDGVGDLAVGAPLDDTGGASTGVTWILFLNADRTCKSSVEIGEGLAGFTGDLDSAGRFGSAVANAGDIDGDGVVDLVVGAPLSSGSGTFSTGSVWIVLLNSDGSVKGQQRVDEANGGFMGPLDRADRFGASVAGLGDLDDDGVPDVAVGAELDDDGGTSRGAAYVLFMKSDGTVKAQQKISDTDGGFVPAGGNGKGQSLAGLGDFDGDGIEDLALGSVSSVFMLMLNSNGTVKSQVEVTRSQIGAVFIESVDLAGDVDGDSVPDLILGDEDDDASCGSNCNQGTAYVVLLNANGSFKQSIQLTGPGSGFTGSLDDGDVLGHGVAGLGDLGRDGRLDFVIGAPGDDDGGSDRGAVWILSLDCVAQLAAATVSRNGSGVNPSGFAEVTPPVRGTLWRTTVDILTSGAQASVVLIGLGGPIPGFPTSMGELLCAPPFLKSVQVGGSHAVPLPFDCSLVGQVFSTQGGGGVPRAFLNPAPKRTRHHGWDVLS